MIKYYGGKGAGAAQGCILGHAAIQGTTCLLHALPAERRELGPRREQ